MPLANYALKGVLVPPGTSLVKFVYDPISFRAGAITSLIALVILAMLAAVEIQRRNQAAMNKSVA